MKLVHRLRVLSTLPPDEIGRRVARRLRRKAFLLSSRLQDSLISSYASSGPGCPLYRYVPEDLTLPSEPWLGELAAWGEAALAHRFDVLGSGFVHVAFGSPATGIEGVCHDLENRASPGINVANRRESQRLRGLIKDDDYQPIDWQLDFKSGYRFDAKAWRASIPIGESPGVDIKVPWELARMQHLPRLALACWAALANPGDERFAPPQRYIREFRGQVLDFAAANPPRFGVNWVCPMEAGIRAANILLAYDLFVAKGASFDAAFTAAVSRMAHEHGMFLASNLEWDEAARGNHYLANVAGLVFIAAYLPRTPVTDVWLAFASKALQDETFFQFHPDGGNFEGSTAYHRLSAQMVLYAAAILLGLPQEKYNAFAEYDSSLWSGPPSLADGPAPLYPVPGLASRRSPLAPEFFERLGRIVRFTADVAKPDGRVPQFGDNDSGRFFNLLPALARDRSPGSWPGEDILDHRHLADAGQGLFTDPALRDYAGARSFEAELAAGLAGLGDRRIAVNGAAAVRTLDAEARFLRLRDRLQNDSALRSRSLSVPLPAPSIDPTALSSSLFPDFGLALLTGQSFYLAVRCPEPGPKRLSGHAHCDLLTVELHHAGRDLIADPGSYLYTPFPALRNAYRGPAAHFIPLLDGVAPADLDLDLFELSWRVTCKRLSFCRLGFIGEITGPGCLINRVVEVFADRVLITDYAPADGPALLSPFCPEFMVTDGYGTKTTRPVCTF